MVDVERLLEQKTLKLKGNFWLVLFKVSFNGFKLFLQPAFRNQSLLAVLLPIDFFIGVIRPVIQAGIHTAWRATDSLAFTLEDIAHWLHLYK